MPNTFAYVALLSWPLVVVALFRLLSLPYALPISIMGGYLFLPEQTFYDLPFLPPIDKTSVPSISAAIMCFWIARSRSNIAKPSGTIAAESLTGTPNTHDHAKREGSRRSAPLGFFVAILMVSPWITALNNVDPVVAGPTFLQGLRPHDALSMTGSFLVMLIPFFLARRFLANPDAHLKLLKAIVGLAAVYAFLVLFEARMSPQLNVWIYGFFGHSWIQHLRGDGYRPLVFLNHGLWLSIFIAMSLLSALALRRCGSERWRTTAFFLLIWLGVTLYFCRSVGAIVIATFMGLLLVMASRKLQLLIAASIAIAILAYPALRGSGLIPVDRVQAAAEWFSEERAESLSFRLRNEDQLLDRANQKPITGWGGFGRNRVWDAETGHDLSVTDGTWITVIGQYGWLGYIAIFGLLTLPTILLWINRRLNEVPTATAGIIIVMVAALIDLIPNGTLTPVTWLFAGAAAGYYRHVKTLSAAQNGLNVSDTDRRHMAHGTGLPRNSTAIRNNRRRQSA